jgi:nitrogen regulatory protein PII
MMKMIMIAYNEAIDAEVTEVLTHCGLKYYTKLTGVFGSGVTSGIHEGNDIWPGRNNILYVVCDEKQVTQMLSCIKELRKKLGKEGIKAFVLPVEEAT